MTRRVRSLYRWDGGNLELTGLISEARLRAWEYEIDRNAVWGFDAGEFRDTVRRWRTTRPDLRVPEVLFVGDVEREATR
jgi:hypothetical protein